MPNYSLAACPCLQSDRGSRRSWQFQLQDSTEPKEPADTVPYALTARITWKLTFACVARRARAPPARPHGSPTPGRGLLHGRRRDCMEREKKLTLSCSVTVSCWFHGVAMATPVCDRCPSRANELCVVSHAYRLNGRSRACHTAHGEEQRRHATTVSVAGGSNPMGSGNVRTYLGLRVDGSDAGAARPHVAVGHTRLAVQPGVAVPVQRARLAHLPGRHHHHRRAGRPGGAQRQHQEDGYGGGDAPEKTRRRPIPAPARHLLASLFCPLAAARYSSSGRAVSVCCAPLLAWARNFQLPAKEARRRRRSKQAGAWAASLRSARVSEWCLLCGLQGRTCQWRRHGTPPCVVFLGPGRSNFVFPSAPRMLVGTGRLGSASSDVGPARRVTGGAWSCCPGSGGRWPGGLGRGGIRRFRPELTVAVVRCAAAAARGSSTAR